MCFTCVVKFISTMKKIEQMGIKHICDVFPNVGWFSFFIFLYFGFKKGRNHLIILINLFQALKNQLACKVFFLNY